MKFSRFAMHNILGPYTLWLLQIWVTVCAVALGLPDGFSGIVYCAVYPSSNPPYSFSPVALKR